MPINSASIPALRVARAVRRRKRAEGGEVFDLMSGIRVGGESSDEPAPDPQGRLSKALSRLTGTQFGEPRHQLWPEKMVRSGATLAGDVLSGDQAVLPPGLRREDYTDAPAPSGPTQDSTWLGNALGMPPVQAQPNDPMMERAQDMAGMAGGQTLLTGTREAAPAAQRVLVAAADSQATGAPLAALEHPRYVYHSTPVSNVEAIAERGLVPSNSGTYFAPNERMASAWHDQGNALYRIDPSKVEGLRGETNGLSPPETESLFTTSRVPPSKLEVSLDNGETWRPVNGDGKRLLEDSAGAGAPISALEHATQTPEFKRWFGDSRAVDAQGNPERFYHGTTSDFDTFGRVGGGNQYGGGYYFTKSPESASNYATGDVNRISPDGSAHPNVMPVYLKYDKPYDRRGPVAPGDLRKLEAAANEIEPGFWKKGELARRFERVYPANGDNVAYELGPKANQIIRKAGFDAFVAPDMTVVFDPTQIKSATGNSGAFSRNNSSALFEDSAGTGAPISALERAAEQGYNIDAYHGTSAPQFDAFKRKPNDIGIHFGTSDQANDRISYMAERGRDGEQHIYPVKLKINNPLRVADLGGWNSENLFYGLGDLRDAAGHPLFDKEELRRAAFSSGNEAGRTKALRDLIERKGYDGIVYKNTGETGGSEPFREALNAARSKMDEAFKETRGGDKHAFSFTPEEQQHPAYQEWRKADDSYDRHRKENAQDSYIAFYPNQARSQFAEFDPKNSKKGGLLLEDASVPGAPLAESEHADKDAAALDAAIALSEKSKPTKKKSVIQLPERNRGGSVNPAMAVARNIRRAKGGKVHVGPIIGKTGGRADKVAMRVPNGSYVIPADIISGLGEGNTEAGMVAVHKMFPPHRARGGAVPIMAAHGETVISPEQLKAKFGDDLDHAHRIMDEWVKSERKLLIKTLERLPGPAQD